MAAIQILDDTDACYANGSAQKRLTVDTDSAAGGRAANVVQSRAKTKEEEEVWKLRYNRIVFKPNKNWQSEVERFVREFRLTEDRTKKQKYNWNEWNTPYITLKFGAKTVKTVRGKTVESIDYVRMSFASKADRDRVRAYLAANAAKLEGEQVERFPLPQPTCPRIV